MNEKVLKTKSSDAAMRAAEGIEDASIAIGNKLISKRGMAAIIDRAMEPERGAAREAQKLQERTDYMLNSALSQLASLKRLAGVIVRRESELRNGSRTAIASILATAKQIHEGNGHPVTPEERADSASKTIAALTEERDRLRAELMRWENLEASVCPEDVGFPEYIAALKKQISATSETDGERFRRFLRENAAEVRGWPEWMRLGAYGEQVKP